MSELELKRQQKLAVGVDLVKWAPPGVAALIALAILAFWPTYLANPSELGTFYTHLHAGTATIWFLLLIVQPLLIRFRRRQLHRTLGYSSYVLAPLVVLCIFLGGHSLLTRWSADEWWIGKYILYLQVSLGSLFGICWILAMYFRKDRQVHARFMVATGLTFLDPVVARIIPVFDGAISQMITFGTVYLILFLLIWLERDAKKGRWVFPLVLALFVVAGLPLFFGVTDTIGWENFSRWFLSLGLT